jgi:hypothetical protein
MVSGPVPQRVVYRQDDEPLYRWENRPPHVVFVEGIPSWNARLPTSLRLYARDGQPTGYVSTTRNPHMLWLGAEDGARYIYRYKLSVPGGIDMVQSLGRAANAEQQEVIFWQGIRARYVVQVDIFDRQMRFVQSITRDAFLAAQSRR